MFHFPKVGDSALCTLKKALTISTRPFCEGEVVNCYVTRVLAAHYAFKYYLPKT